MKLQKLLILYGVFTAAIGGAALLVQQTMPHYFLIPWFWGVFAFMAAITFVAFLFSFLGIKKGGESSILALMATIGLKIFICMGFAIAYLINFKVNGTVFITNFFSLYFLFTAFEVYFLLRNLRHQNSTAKS